MMSEARRRPKADVVIVGLGWSGSILAERLTAAGLDVVAIERGGWRSATGQTPTTIDPDELRYARDLDLFLQPRQETVTFRNNDGQTALPVRKWGAFLLGNGVGGNGLHWNGLTFRLLPTDFPYRSHLESRYGRAAIAPELTVQDWPIGYAELEPYYDRFEYLCGISGQAGNIGGALQPGGNPFEGPRSRPYPLPPLETPHSAHLFRNATERMGLHPVPIPAANTSRAYINPLGVAMGPCTYCGFCDRFGCGNLSKGSPQTTVLPVVTRRDNFRLLTNSQVVHVNRDGSGKRATGVNFVDVDGQLWEQPADLVLLSAFGLHNVHLMLLSGIGAPYDPVQNTGVVGRNFAYQTMAETTLFLDKIINPFMGAGALGTWVDDYNGDNFDHAGLGFVGGSSLMVNQTSGRPIDTRPVPDGTPRWGSDWKQATARHYNRSFSLISQGASNAARGNHLDLDPTYTDFFGRKLLRMTFDFPENDRRLSRFMLDRLSAIGRTIGADSMHASDMAAGPFSTVPYQSTHVVGGAAMAAEPSQGPLNRYQQSWDVSNLFVLGASSFPQNYGYNPTGTVGALAFWTADAILHRYLKNPGPLVSA